MCRRHDTLGCGTEIILSILPCIAEYAITVGSIVERARRGNAAVCPAALICNIDYLICMYEASVLCTASKVFFTETGIVVCRAVFDKRLCGAGSSDIQRSLLLHDNRFACLDRHDCRIFVKLDDCISGFVCDSEFISIIADFCRWLCITV